MIEMTKNENYDENAESSMFIIQLLMEEPCEIPKKSTIEKVLKKHLGEVDCYSYSDEVICTAVGELTKNTENGPITPAVAILGSCEFDESEIEDIYKCQMWDCKGHEEILKSCKYRVIAADMMTEALYYKDRANMDMDYLEALVELYPTCKAVYFENSGKLFTAEEVRSHNIPRDERFVYFAVNVRFFKIKDTEDFLVDSLGMRSVSMPDLQYHFNTKEIPDIIRHAYELLIYMFVLNNPIGNGNSVDGMVDGQITDSVKWVCRYDSALIEPARDVISIIVE